MPGAAFNVFARGSPRLLSNCRKERINYVMCVIDGPLSLKTLVESIWNMKLSYGRGARKGAL